MSLFAPVNMMAPANRAGAIQAAAAAAQQNVLRRQRLQKLLSAGAKSGPVSLAQPFRNSFMTRAAAARPNLVRQPGGPGNAGINNITRLLGQQNGNYVGAAVQNLPQQPEFPSLAYPGGGAGGAQAVPNVPQAGAPTPNMAAYGVPQAGGPRAGQAYVGAGAQAAVAGAGQALVNYIPLGGGLFYDPANDVVHNANPQAQINGVGFGHGVQAMG